MKSRHEVYLNDIPLESISPKIRVLDIAYKPGTLSVDTYERSIASGSIVKFTRRESYTVTVSFALLAYSVRERTVLMQEIAKWASKGGKLVCSDRPRQFLYCICTQLPVIDSAQKWSDGVKMVFTAYGLPFWQDDEFTTFAVSGQNSSGLISDKGVEDGYPEVRLVVSSGTLNTLSINVGETYMNFTGLGIPANGNFVITHAWDTWLLQILGNGASVYSKRTEDSWDELRSKAGEINTIVVSANTALTGEIIIRGLHV